MTRSDKQMALSHSQICTHHLNCSCRVAVMSPISCVMGMGEGQTAGHKDRLRNQRKPGRKAVMSSAPKYNGRYYCFGGIGMRMPVLFFWKL